MKPLIHAVNPAPSDAPAKGATSTNAATRTAVQAQRRDDREWEGRVLARAIVAARSSHGAVSKALGCSRQYVDRLCAGVVPIGSHHRRRLPPSVLAQYAEQLAATADRSLDPVLPWHHHASLLVKELGEANAALLQGAAADDAEREIADVVRAGQRWLSDHRRK